MSKNFETIEAYRKRVQDMVAPRSQVGTHATGRTGYSSEPPRQRENGKFGKPYRKMVAKLNARLKDHAATINRDSKNEPAYRKPGAMKL